MLYIEIDNKKIAVPQNALAYKYADPVDGARWIYDMAEAQQIRSEDHSLLITKFLYSP